MNNKRKRKKNKSGPAKAGRCCWLMLVIQVLGGLRWVGSPFKAIK
jgi:hypothetical protein